ncbi:unnamed protein product [Heligmosomoides polygyrus]|uniref:N-acetyltransferase n=1 Tax=Heligmosomoides polygyrus TaxID=6339 RepID=A0A183GK21_HELPZ|nr:unnamed protein product [Heligmosomoides polygyrus]
MTTPNIHRVEIRQVGWSDVPAPKAWEELLASGDRGFGGMRRCSVLLKRKSSFAKMARRLRLQYASVDTLLVAVRVCFDVVLHEDQGALRVAHIPAHTVTEAGK